MAKSFISPGVFTNEIDASFLAPGVGSIGAALLGLAPKGPAFVPVTVTNFGDEFLPLFGDVHEDYMLTYAAKAYLKNAATANIVRVLGPAGRTVNGSTVTPGYTAESMWAITAFTGAGGGFATGSLMAVLEITGSHSLVINTLVNDKFDLRITGTNSAYDVYVTASFVSGSANYIGKVLETDPTQFATKGYYLRHVYDYNLRKLGDPTLSLGSASYNSASLSTQTNFQMGYNSGSSPWIKSQVFGGSSEYNVFRVHTLGHGEAEVGRLKVSIKNIKPSIAPAVNPYGTFDLEVRSFADSDGDAPLESFTNLSLDPQSTAYLPKVVGDRLIKYDFTKDKMLTYGNYANKSRLIRIEMTTGTLPQAALPWGFRGLERPLVYVSSSLHGVATGSIGQIPYVADMLEKRSDGTQGDSVSTAVYWGVETKLSGSILGRLHKLPSMTDADPDFSLKFISGSAEGSTVSGHGLSYRKDLFDKNILNSTNFKEPGTSTAATTLGPTVAKFTAPVAFGFDGFDRRLSNPLDNTTQLATISQLGTQALRQAIDVIKDPDFMDINLLAIPGIYSTKVTDYAISKIEDRADAFYVMDVQGSSVSEVVSNLQNRSLDTNYAGCYYPGVVVNTTTADNVAIDGITIPSSIPAIAAIAYNDRVAYPWFAPAGLNRAGLSPDVLGLNVALIAEPLKQTERDSLYENRINPIAVFPDVPQGVIWGQKTLQLKSSALDRINVRRLMIKAKKLVASAVKFLVFEPNNAATQTRFRQLVNPILADIQQKQGLEVFKVIMDSTTNTPELIDRNIMAGKILLVPTRTAEFISVDFVISPSGAAFEE